MNLQENSIEKRTIRWLLANAANPKRTNSARAIICHMSQGVPISTGDAKADADNAPVAAADVINCMQLLEEIPEWKPRMHEMGEYSAGWKNIAEVWEHLAEMLAKEAKITPESDRSVRRARRGDPIPANSLPDYKVRLPNEVVLCDTLEEVYEATGRGWSYQVSSPTGKDVDDFIPY